MNDLLEGLPRSARRGSKPRCHGLTHGARHEVAGRLTGLIKPYGGAVGHGDKWMPDGFNDPTEAQLHECGVDLRGKDRDLLESWWFQVKDKDSKSPNWDIASTCLIDGKRGLLLVEAKAHVTELTKTREGKRYRDKAKENGQLNNARITRCLEQANAALSKVTGGLWALSLESHYQMSNRFAWAWKLADHGIPVILLYLGFLGVRDLNDEGQSLGTSFADDLAWEKQIRAHSGEKPLFPDSIWNKKWKIKDASLTPVIQTLDWPLKPE